MGSQNWANLTGIELYLVKKNLERNKMNCGRRQEGSGHVGRLKCWRL